MPGKFSRVEKCWAVAYKSFNLSKLVGLGFDPSPASLIACVQLLRELFQLIKKTKFSTLLDLARLPLFP